MKALQAYVDQKNRWNAIFKQNWTMAGSAPPISAVKQHFGVE
jgi:hypothetical protein